MNFTDNYICKMIRERGIKKLFNVAVGNRGFNKVKEILKTTFLKSFGPYDGRSKNYYPYNLLIQFCADFV